MYGGQDNNAEDTSSKSINELFGELKRLGKEVENERERDRKQRQKSAYKCNRRIAFPLNLPIVDKIKQAKKVVERPYVPVKHVPKPSAKARRMQKQKEQSQQKAPDGESLASRLTIIENNPELK